MECREGRAFYRKWGHRLLDAIERNAEPLGNLLMEFREAESVFERAMIAQVAQEPTPLEQMIEVASCESSTD